ncbi:MFS transporter, partial [Burkholderia multivorans]
CFLITYPLAGVLGAAIGLPAVALVLVGIGILGAVLATTAWSATSRTLVQAHKR